MSLPPSLTSQAQQICQQLKSNKQTLVTAESCTGGMIAAVITAIAGSSAVFEGGFVTYSNAMKHRFLGVPEDILENKGAVSFETAKAMAEGAQKAAQVDLAVSVTGIAGPGGATDTKPVGLVYVGLAVTGQETQVKECHFDGDRDAVRQQTAETALGMILQAI